MSYFRTLDLTKFDLPALMGALGASEGSMQEMKDDPEIPARFRDCAAAWLEQLELLSAEIARVHNETVKGA